MSVVAVGTPDKRGHSMSFALIYLGIPAYFVVVGFSLRDLTRSHSVPVAAVAWMAVALFSAVFVWLALTERETRPAGRMAVPIVVLGVLAIALALLGSTSAVYLIVVAAMAGDCLDAPVAVAVILAATAGVFAYSVLAGLGPQQTVTQSLLPLVVGLLSLGAERLAETNRQLIAVREELADVAVIKERLRFGRDLHDLLGHSLTVIRAKSELASRLASIDPLRAGQEMTEVEAVARQSLAEVREAVSGYRRLSLAAEIANARSALGAAGIAAEVAMGGLEIAAEQDAALGWVLREAITNVVRHSGARRCRVEATCDDRDVRLEVADDGPGLMPDAPAGNGLAGVRERLAAVGGRLELLSAPGGGLRLVARVPRPS